MNWYQFEQNNSGGYFDVNDKVCHRLFIEAESLGDAIKKAENLGCYWDGVFNNIDCPCCGDRWSKWGDNSVDIEEYNTDGYTVSVYDGIYGDAKDEWEHKYRKYEVIEEPEFKTIYSTRKYVGKIRFNNIEQYAQFLADQDGWTVPDARLYYHDGSIKEIFSTKFDN